MHDGSESFAAPATEVDTRARFGRCTGTAPVVVSADGNAPQGHDAATVHLPAHRAGLDYTPLSHSPDPSSTQKRPHALALIYRRSQSSGDAVRELALHCHPDQRVELLPCSSAEHVAERVQAAVERGVERIVVAGGDGTIRDAVHGLGPEFPDVELAVLPLGTGNDLARSLGTRVTMERAVQIALEAPAVRADVAEITVNDERRSWFVNVANGGFGGEVANRIERTAKQRWGAFAYWMSTVGTLTHAPSYEIELRIDDQEPTQREVSGIAIANGRFLGGGFPVARDARIDDGRLDIVLAPPMEPHEFLRSGMDLAFGRADRNDAIELHRAKKVDLRTSSEIPFSVDGDLVDFRHGVFEVRPGALHVVAGPDASGLRGEPSLWDEDTTPIGEGDAA